MIERYLEGIDLPLLRTDVSPELTAVANRLPTVTGTIRVPVIGSVEDVTIIESPSGWDLEDVLVNYRTVLKSIETSLKITLPTDNRFILLVTPKELIPTNQEEKRKLVEKYGSHILDGIDGDCTRQGEGFRIRLGYKGLEKSTPLNKVLEVLAHEYGHTLGERIDSPVWEELKAYAFQALFMRHYSNVRYFIHGYFTHEVSSEEVHEIAEAMWALLITRGIKEEEILSHLIGGSFGPFQPKDYLMRTEASFLARSR